MEIDIAPLLEYGLQLIAAVVLAIVGRLGMMANTKFKTDIDVSKGGIVDNAINRGVDYALSMVKGSDGKVNIYVRNHLVALAAKYAMAKVPETLAHFNISEERLKEMVEARMSKFGAAEAEPEEPETMGEYKLPAVEIE